MTRQGGTGLLPIAIQHIDHPRRKSGLLDQARQIEDREGRLLGRLDDDGIAAGEGGAQLPRRHGERVVPGDDLGADADGLAQGVGEFLGGGGDGLAVQLVGPAGVVAEAGDDLAQVLGERHAVGFAVVPGLDGGERFGVGFD